MVAVVVKRILKHNMDQFDKEEDRKPSPTDNKTIKSGSNQKAPPIKKSSSKKKKKKSQQADDMPIRPLSAYNLFFRDERARLLKAREDGDAGEIGSARAAELFSAMGKTIAKRWRELPAEERVVYTTVADKDSKRYQKEKEEYQLKLAKMDKEQVQAIEKKPQARHSAFVAVKPNSEMPIKSSDSAKKSLNASISDHSQGSQVAAMPSYERADLARFQLQNASNVPHMTAANEQPSNLALLRANLMAQEQSRIDDILRAQQIQTLMGRSSVPLGGLGQSNQLTQNSSLTSQDLYLASLSNSLAPSTHGTGFRGSQNVHRDIQQAIMRQERLNALNAQQQSYETQLALASQQQQLRHQQLLQNALGQHGATNTNLSSPLLSQLLSQQSQIQGSVPPSEGNDESSEDGQNQDYNRSFF